MEIKTALWSSKEFAKNQRGLKVLTSAKNAQPGSKQLKEDRRFGKTTICPKRFQSIRFDKHFYVNSNLLSESPTNKKNPPAVFSVKLHKSQSLPDDDLKQQKNHKIIKTTLTFQFLIYLSFYDISLIYPSNLSNKTISKIK